MGWFRRRPKAEEAHKEQLMIAAGMIKYQTDSFGGSRPLGGVLVQPYALGYVAGITNTASETVFENYHLTPAFQTNLAAAYIFTFQDEDEGTAAFESSLAITGDPNYQRGFNDGAADFKNYKADARRKPHRLADHIRAFFTGSE